jgi:AAA+ superfamily predicted ATPase
MFIGDGAKMVRDAFALAKEKAPCIIFIDEIDAIGTKRFDSELSGDREVQRTMLELLNQLDGFASSDDVKVGPTAVEFVTGAANELCSNCCCVLKNGARVGGDEGKSNGQN